MVDSSGLHYLRTESSDDCVGVFHSSELEDPTMYVEGFYIAAFVSPVVGCIVGPYLTEERAIEAMVAGVWMGEQAGRLERNNGAYRAKRDA
jgi:hypothetical protein